MADPQINPVVAPGAPGQRNIYTLFQERLKGMTTHNDTLSQNNASLREENATLKKENVALKEEIAALKSPANSIWARDRSESASAPIESSEGDGSNDQNLDSKSTTGIDQRLDPPGVGDGTSESSVAIGCELESTVAKSPSTSSEESSLTANGSTISHISPSPASSQSTACSTSVQPSEVPATGDSSTQLFRRQPDPIKVLCSSRETSCEQIRYLFLSNESFQSVDKLVPESDMRGDEVRYCTCLSFSDSIGARIAIADMNGTIFKGYPLELAVYVESRIDKKRPLEIWIRGWNIELRSKEDRLQLMSTAFPKERGRMTYKIEAFDHVLDAIIDKYPGLDILAMDKEKLLFPALHDDQSVLFHRAVILNSLGKLKERWSEIEFYDVVFEMYLPCSKAERTIVPFVATNHRNEIGHEDEGISAWLVDNTTLLEFIHEDLDKFEGTWSIEDSRRRDRIAHERYLRDENTD
ncbi:hypothetical protein VTL71DRAFT_2941 [Oculimacula yallundae]|uniref:Uncharacterized protein n=1 Tax=Oculimacula yallundae TaxID=86028 RepID=A0ABR4C5Q6_9HELO